MAGLDMFFELGNKATKGDPTRKALFDYLLYWILFITFVALAINYYYIFFTKGVTTSLMWGIILTIFCWFNYWALSSFRMVYQNMKRYSDAKKLVDKVDKKDEPVESVEDMIRAFEDKSVVKDSSEK